MAAPVPPIPPSSNPTTTNPAIDAAIAKLEAANTKAAVLSVNTSIETIAAKAIGDALKNVR